MHVIAIDGACRRNGKPDCVSSGGIFIRDISTGICQAFAVHEYNSTNQRGELHALLKALEYIHEHELPACIVTDSEYLFNAMTKSWPQRWSATGWRTAAGDTVKNADLWKSIVDIYSRISVEVIFYHIKGHVIPFGKVTAQKSLEADPTGYSLYEEALIKFFASAKLEAIQHAQELSERNNGFKLPAGTFECFVAANVVVDAVATVEVESADRNI